MAGGRNAREAVIRLCVLAFLAGILLVQQMASLPSLGWSWLLVPLMLLAWRVPRAGLPLLFLVAGVLWADLRAGLLLAERLAPEYEGVDLHVEGRVADLPTVHEHGLRFDFDIERARQDERPAPVPRRVRLSLYGPAPALAVGDRWAFTVRLKRPHGFQNPGGIDSEAHLFQSHIRATGYVRTAESPRLLAELGSLDNGLLPGYRLDRYRQRLSARIQQLLPDPRFVAMITAFANGDDKAIPDEQWQVLTATGTIHLVAISGMNIGLVAGLVFFVVRGLWSLPGLTVLWVPAPRVAAAAALLAALAYAALAGFAIPTQRALIMLGVALGTVYWRRSVAPSVMLSIALFVVLLVDPLAVLSAGFWLSFAAVALILYFMIGATRHPSRTARLADWIRLQWAIAIGLLPLLLFLFQRVSLSGPLANLLAIPVIESLVIPSTLLGVAASLVLPDSLASGPFQFAALVLSGLWPALAWMAQYAEAQWVQHSPPAWALAAALIGAGLLLAPRGFPARWLGLVWMLPLFLVRPVLPAPGELRLTLLDVGQGLSAVIQTAGHTLVYDTGARRNVRFDAGRLVLLPFLHQAGIRQVDTLIVSHGDNDHIGGSMTLLSAMPVVQVLSSVPERLPAARACRRGQVWEWDGVHFAILHPPANNRFRGNNRSCVLRVSSRYGRVLLPGDIAVPAEYDLVQQLAAQLPAEILIAPHHGSKTSSSAEFLDRVQPRLALLPVGYRNRYHHPHPQVTARYRARDIALDDSARSGAITVDVTRAGLVIDRYRVSRRRYWMQE